MIFVTPTPHQMHKLQDIFPLTTFFSEFSGCTDVGSIWAKISGSPAESQSGKIWDSAFKTRIL